LSKPGLTKSEAMPTRSGSRKDYRGLIELTHHREEFSQVVLNRSTGKNHSSLTRESLNRFRGLRIGRFEAMTCARIGSAPRCELREERLTFVANDQTDWRLSVFDGFDSARELFQHLLSLFVSKSVNQCQAYLLVTDDENLISSRICESFDATRLISNHDSN